MTRLTDAERREHSRRADSFPPNQLVYSLVDVEDIIRSREQVYAIDAAPALSFGTLGQAEPEHSSAGTGHDHMTHAEIVESRASQPEREHRCLTCGLPDGPDYGDPHECPPGFTAPSQPEQEDQP